VNVGEIALPSELGEADSHRTFERLMATHEQLVLRTAYRLLGSREDAQDAAQEVFLKLLGRVDRIEGDGSAWLYRVTVNVCNDFYRRRRPSLELVEARDPRPGPDTEIALDERKRLLMRGLKMLSERERAAIVLRDIEGLPTREVAAILDVEEVTIRSQICVARVKLAKYVRGRI
jgi:RNA polymerase sigma-70 factor, ECF subfamily